MGFFGNIVNGVGMGIGNTLTNKLLNKGQEQQPQSGVYPNQQGGYYPLQQPQQGYYPQQQLPMSGQQQGYYPQRQLPMMQDPVTGQMIPAGMGMSYSPRHVSDLTMQQLLSVSTGTPVASYVVIEDNPPVFTHICPLKTPRENPICQIPMQVISVVNTDGTPYDVPCYYCGRCGQLVACKTAYR